MANIIDNGITETENKRGIIMTTQFLVIPLNSSTNDIVKVNASSRQVAINKFRKTFPIFNEVEVIVCPVSHAYKTISDVLIPLWKIEMKEVP